MKEKIKKLLKDSFFYQIWAVIRSFAAAAIWFVFGQNNSPSELIKRLLIKGFAKAFNINVFVETGTYLGDTVGFLSRQFREIHSIELSHEFVLTVRKRFSSRKNILKPREHFMKNMVHEQYLLRD